MKKILFILIFALLSAEQTIVVSEQPIQDHPKKFGYVSLGGCGWILPIFSPEAAFGLRKLTSKHAWDVQSGASLTGKYFWGQASYLYFFIPTNTSQYASPYLGIGLSGGYSQWKNYASSSSKNSPYLNTPITIGFQWGENKENHFFQIQISPLLITTASFGAGF